MISLELLFFSMLSSVSADVIRSVYCKNVCADYLHISESVMPKCDTNYAMMTSCGTVISCDPQDAARYQNRPLINSTEYNCCYLTDVKEHGDCDPREVVEHLRPKIVVSDGYISSCADSTIAWTISFILLIIVVMESTYIFYTLIFHPQQHKVSHCGSAAYPSQPIILARPLVHTQLHQHLLEQQA